MTPGYVENMSDEQFETLMSSEFAIDNGSSASEDDGIDGIDLPTNAPSFNDENLDNDDEDKAANGSDIPTVAPSSFVSSYPSSLAPTSSSPEKVDDIDNENEEQVSSMEGSADNDEEMMGTTDRRRQLRGMAA